MPVIDERPSRSCTTFARRPRPPSTSRLMQPRRIELLQGGASHEYFASITGLAVVADDRLALRDDHDAGRNLSGDEPAADDVRMPFDGPVTGPGRPGRVCPLDWRASTREATSGYPEGDPRDMTHSRTLHESRLLIRCYLLRRLTTMLGLRWRQPHHR